MEQAVSSKRFNPKSMSGSYDTVPQGVPSFNELLWHCTFTQLVQSISYLKCLHINALALYAFENYKFIASWNSLAKYLLIQ